MSPCDTQNEKVQLRSLFLLHLLVGFFVGFGAASALAQQLKENE